MIGGSKVGESFSITEKSLERYYYLNQQQKEITQELNYLKKLFHKALDKELGKYEKGKIEYGGYIIQRQIRESTNYRNEETVQKLSNLNLEDFIQVIRSPDKDKLEAAIKLGLVDEKDFEGLKETKFTQAIIVKENV